MEHTFTRNVKTEKTDLQVSTCKTASTALVTYMYMLIMPKCFTTNSQEISSLLVKITLSNIYNIYICNHPTMQYMYSKAHVWRGILRVFA